MPPKSRITRQMILDAGFQVIRELGLPALNVRSVASRLNCSTQPIMYHFATMEDLKTELYTIASNYHAELILNVDLDKDPNPCLTMNRRYIRFALEEPCLFRFLFQSDRFANRNVEKLLEKEQFSAVFHTLAQIVGLTPEQAWAAFTSNFIAVHGFASLLANNSMEYDGAYCDKLLECVFRGSIDYIRESYK